MHPNSEPSLIRGVRGGCLFRPLTPLSGGQFRRRHPTIRVFATPVPFVCVPKLSDYAMLIRPTTPPSPQPSSTRGEGVKSLSSPLMGEDKGEGDQAVEADA